LPDTRVIIFGHHYLAAGPSPAHNHCLDAYGQKNSARWSGAAFDGGVEIVQSAMLSIATFFLLTQVSALAQNPQAASIPQGPRDHHYEFAHKYLTDLFFQDPMKLQLFLVEKGDSALRFFWKRAGKRFSADQQIPYQGLEMEELRPNSQTKLILITTPKPIGITETYYIAMVLQGN